MKEKQHFHDYSGWCSDDAVRLEPHFYDSLIATCKSCVWYGVESDNPDKDSPYCMFPGEGYYDPAEDI